MVDAYFPTKTELLKEVVQTAIVGDSLPIPASGRGWFQAVLDEADPARRAARLARASTEFHQRTAALFTVARSAAVNPDSAALLADELGFTPETYERWLRHQLAALFEQAGK